jgi:molecular chaperone GrpE
MKELLTVADGFEKAFASSPPDSPWLEGVKMIYSNLKAILASYGVQKIDAVGKEFNPEFHEAVEVVQTQQESDDNTVVEELQSGYRVGERVLKATKVKVAKYQSN